MTLCYVVGFFCEYTSCDGRFYLVACLLHVMSMYITVAYLLFADVPLRNYTLFIVWQMKYLIWSYKVRCKCIRLIILYGNCCHWSLSVKLCLVMASLVRSLPCEIICDRRGRAGIVDEDVKPRCVNSVLCGPVGRRSNYTFCRSVRPSVRLFVCFVIIIIIIDVILIVVVVNE